MVERREPWLRRCPDCDTEFKSVQSWGVCPGCELRFSVESNGNMLTREDKSAPRSGIALSERTQKLIAKLFSRSDGVVISDLLYRAVSSNIPYFDNANSEEMERIRFAILKMTKQSPLNLAVGIYLAQTDWRDLLMSAGFGDDTSEYMTWYVKQLNPNDGYQKIAAKCSIGRFDLH